MSNTKSNTKTFRQAVQRGNVAGPGQRKFSEVMWCEKFEKVPDLIDDLRLFTSGKWFARRFSEIRARIEELKNRYPILVSPSATRLYVGFSNAQVQPHSRRLEQNFRTSSAASVSEMMDARVNPIWPSGDGSGPSFNATALLETSVEAIRFPLSQISDADCSGQEKIPLWEMFVFVNLGVMYHIYERKWLDCLWNGYFLDEDRVDYDLMIPADERIAVMDAVYEHRNDSFIAEFALRTDVLWRELPQQIKEEYRVSASVDSRGKISKVVSRDSPERAPQAFLLRIMGAEQYWDDILDEPLAKLEGASILHCLFVGRILGMIAEALLRHCPADDPEGDDATILAKKWTIPIAVLEIVRFVRSLSTLSATSVRAILKLFTFEDHKTDLWNCPLVSCGKARVAFVIASATGANPIRRIEYLMQAVGIDEGRKGKMFEAHVRARVKSAMEAVASNIVLDVGHLPFHKGAEELDLIIRIGDCILVCECKCSGLPVEPVEKSLHRALLAAAADQVRRKADFVRENLDLVFSRLNWGIPCSGSLIFPVVVSNVKYGVGFPIDGVPIVDVFVLLRYFDGGLEVGPVDFKTGEVDLRSGGTKVVFFRDIQEMQNNIYGYLLHPPQIEVYRRARRVFKHGPLPPVTAEGKPVFLVHLDIAGIGIEAERSESR